jgi:hypothetical protein
MLETGLEADYPEIVSCFSSVSPGTCQNSTLNQATATSFYIIFQIIINIILSFNAIYSELFTA